MKKPGKSARRNPALRPAKGKKSRDDKADQDFYGGLIRLHILHHAAVMPIFGLWLMQELGRHGYRIGPGTLYPILHSLERRGLLRSRVERDGRARRRVYVATPKGRRALARAKGRVRELYGELLELEEEE
jgi:PadR family transcriptional regulator, regulatory protein PadR